MSNKTLELITGTILTMFIIFFGSIIMFGYMNTINGNIALFKAIYFAFILTVSVTVYLMNIDTSSTVSEHVLIIIAVIVFSASMATMVGNLKNNYDVNQYFKQSGDIEELAAQNQYYSQYTAAYASRLETLRTDNQILEDTLTNLTARINNKKPIIVETILTLPAEIIYEESPVTYQEYEDEEGEDDD